MIPPRVRRIYVGKRAGKHSAPQQEINALLVEEAQKGSKVVRLKGGDPFLFGRGGEELEALLEHGIPFEVVPGVPSAIAVPAYAGIPVTHRTASSSLHIFTGHTKDGLPQFDYPALTLLKGTLVFLMGVTALPHICKGLINAGMDTKTPAAIIQQGTSAAQRQVVSTVANLPQDSAQAGISSPAVIVIGKVCALPFAWAEHRPFNGKKILVTRPRDRASSLSQSLREQGAEVVEYPCISTKEIEPNPELEQALFPLNQYSWIAFTSPVGVEYFWNRLRRMAMDTRGLHGVRLAAIGSATARALEGKGLLADYVPKEYSAARLGEGLAKRVEQGGLVLLARAKEGSPDLPRALTERGIRFRDVALYETCYESGQTEDVLRMLDAGELDYLTFTSASTVRGFVRATGRTSFSGIRAVCIGQATEREAKQYDMQTLVAPQASIESMVQCIMEQERGERRGFTETAKKAAQK